MTKQIRFKLIIVVVIVFTATFLSGFYVRNVYAYTNDQSALDEAKGKYSSYDSYVVLKHVYNEKTIYSVIYGNEICIAMNVDGYINQKGYIDIDNNSETRKVNDLINGEYGEEITGNAFIMDNATILYSKNNIYEYDYQNRIKLNTVFFSPPKQTILPKQVQTKALHPVLSQVMIMIPIVMACLVGWVALRKALQVLQQILSQA